MHTSSEISKWQDLKTFEKLTPTCQRFLWPTWPPADHLITRDETLQMPQLSESIKDTVDKLFSGGSALRRERKLSLDSRNRNKKNGAVVAWAARSILVHNGVKSSLLRNVKLKKKWSKWPVCVQWSVDGKLQRDLSWIISEPGQPLPLRLVSADCGWWLW